MKTFIIEEEYSALRTYEVQARSEKEARAIYLEGPPPLSDDEFESKILTVTAVTKHEDGSYSKR